ncbi:MAG: FAD-dependent oxidoreductase, partial [Bryobacteraceae bacterium]
LTLEVYELIADGDKARQFGVDKVPATIVASEKDYGIRFFGVTGGYEFGSLVEDIEMVSRGVSGLSREAEQLARLIVRPVHLEVMVTLTCPYCPRMVRLAHQLAFLNEAVTADMVDASEFPQLAQRYQVHGVPRTVINGRPAFEGALEPVAAIIEILRVGNPREYERIEALAREARGERLVSEPDPAHLYDVAIVGAGPAAFTAAIYAARKMLDVVLLGDEPGGQVNDTALVENWPGIPEVGGLELAESLRHHAEHYRFAMALHVTVERVDRENGTFQLRLAGGTQYQARSVIYCAGKRYRRLGVPGEDRFIGRGIAFCATCDAPLFRGKRVAVIGGGNSAFTAARDLLSYARQIDIFNILPDWQADRVLFEEVTRSGRVRLHPATRVVEFLGRESLQGLRVESIDGQQRTDFLVEGVFLEIGLTPNSTPVEHLVKLNEAGEIPVDRNQATAVPGLFAAGDVTDEPEKQIVVAAAAGAKAALAAHRYLLGLTGNGGH